MIAAQRYFDSSSLGVDEDFMTITSRLEKDLHVELSQPRIKSFYYEPSLEPDDEDILFDNKKEKGTSPILAPVRKNPVALVPKSDYRPRIFNAIKSWEGFVIDIYQGYFAARITDLNEKEQDEDVEILLKDVSEDDKKLVVPGAIFYWHVGYENERGTVKRSSIIRFRRMPRWSSSDFRKARELEAKIKKLFQGDE